MNRMQERYECLFAACQKFIRDNEILCPESIYQMDHVAENALEFIEEIAEIVGYHVSEDEED